MRAIVQDRYGPPSRLQVREAPEPTVGDHDVLVAVRAASLHPDVWHAVAGRPWILRLMGAGVLGPRRAIPGTDMAGVVERVGAGVTRFAPGDEVFGETGAANQWANGGAFAERVAAPADNLERKPTNVSFEQAASVPSSGLITLQNLPERSWFEPERRVLINGAGGGVGTLALQILVSWGARVTAVDTAGKLDLLRSLGAEHVVDFRREDPTEGDERYDYVFDVPALEPYRVWRRVLTEEGRYVPIGHEGYGRRGKNLFGLIPTFLALMVRARFDRHLGSGRSALPVRRETIVTLRELLESGAVLPVIDRVYPLEEVHEAFRHLMEDELQGKVLLAP